MVFAPSELFVTVGTDHHPFDRLIDWVDSWLATNSNRRVRCMVQAGTGTTPRHASWSRYLSHDETLAALREATAVVCHGGPGTIMSCRSLGLIPIIVPRRKVLGEHVDDHQVIFARRMAERGDVILAEGRRELWGLLDRAVDEPEAFRAPPPRASADAAIARFGELVDGLLGLDSAADLGQPLATDLPLRSER
jgi:UDP-N-acetylglucosamine transferase subunit ALG13